MAPSLRGCLQAATRRCCDPRGQASRRRRPSGPAPGTSSGKLHGSCHTSTLASSGHVRRENIPDRRGDCRLAQTACRHKEAQTWESTEALGSVGKPDLPDGGTEEGTASFRCTRRGSWDEALARLPSSRRRSCACTDSRRWTSFGETTRWLQSSFAASLQGHARSCWHRGPAACIAAIPQCLGSQRTMPSAQRVPDSSRGRAKLRMRQDASDLEVALPRGWLRDCRQPLGDLLAKSGELTAKYLQCSALLKRVRTLMSQHHAALKKVVALWRRNAVFCDGSCICRVKVPFLAMGCLKEGKNGSAPAPIIAPPLPETVCREPAGVRQQAVQLHV